MAEKKTTTKNLNGWDLRQILVWQAIICWDCRGMPMAGGGLNHNNDQDGIVLRFNNGRPTPAILQDPKLLDVAPAGNGAWVVTIQTPHYYNHSTYYSKAGAKMALAAARKQLVYLAKAVEKQDKLKAEVEAGKK